MKRNTVYIGIALTVLLFLCASIYSRWYRTILYKDLNSDESSGGQIGKWYLEKPDLFRIVNKDNPYDIQDVNPEDINSYDKTLYEITFVPAHTTIEYVTGYFRGWEMISNSNDIYLLLDQGESGVEKFRFLAEANDFAGLSKSTLRIEVFNLSGLVKKENKKFETTTLDLDVKRMIKVFKNGDSVILFPNYSEDGSPAVDINKNIVIENMVIRRAFGISEVLTKQLF